MYRISRLLVPIGDHIMNDSAVQHDPGVVHLLEDLLSRAVRECVTDVHFEPDSQGLGVRFRRDGILQHVDRLPPSIAPNVIARLKVLAGLLTYRPDIPQEGTFRFDLSDTALAQPELRVATFPTVRGERAVVRLHGHQTQVLDIGDLGLAQATTTALMQAVRRPVGLVLITGPAGSGKTTTMHALARYILAATKGRSVVSLEDPVERRVKGIAQIEIQPHGDLNYSRAMRSLLRQDVEVLLVGEIRDPETAHLATEAALTGHLIISTMHSGDPAEAVARLLEMGVPAYQVVSTVTLICSQRLLRQVCRDCRMKDCKQCNGTGYRGRMACGQHATMNETLRAAVVRHAPVFELRKIISGESPDMRADANRLIQLGHTNIEEVHRILGTDDDSRSQGDS